MAKKAVILGGALAVAVLAGGLAGADALGLFGVVKRDYREVVHVRFRAVDAETRRPVGAVYVNCMRRGQQSACSARPGADDEVIDLHVATRRVVERSRLLGFKRAEYDALGLDDSTIYIQFIHPHYGRTVQEHTLAGLRGLQGAVQDVPLAPPDPEGESLPVPEYGEPVPEYGEPGPAEG